MRLDCAPSVKNLTSVKWILIKGGLFLVLGLMAGALLVAQQPTLYAGLLLMIAVWAFCRFYYFAFYVIEHYLDPNDRFAGRVSIARYLIPREQQRP
jgi:hypothetical protein